MSNNKPQERQSGKAAARRLNQQLIDAVSEAASSGVHPAIVYTMLAEMQGNVMFSIKQMNLEDKDNEAQKDKDNEAQKTAAEIIDEHESKIRPAGSAN